MLILVHQNKKCNVSIIFHSPLNFEIILICNQTCLNSLKLIREKCHQRLKEKINSTKQKERVTLMNLLTREGGMYSPVE